MVHADITPLDRGTIRTDLNHIIEGHTVGSKVEPDPETPMGEGPVYNLVIDHPEATILWDTGSHPDAGDGHWPAELYAAFEHYDAADHPLDEALAAQGYSIEDIDAVVQSHLHLDHAGGLHHFDETDVPIYVHEEELKFAYYSAKTNEGSDAYVSADFDHDLNWHVVHGDDGFLYEGVEYVHLPGHTPGLIGLQLDFAEQGTVLVIGDVAYMRTNYDDEHPLGAGLLWSKRHWVDSLRELKDRERRNDATVICGHAREDLERLHEGI